MAIFTKPSDTNQKINGYLLTTNERIYTDVSLQKYEITGSQHWNVGRIEMSELNQFHIKDSSKITLHDLQEGIYYPSIDITDQSSGDTTLVVTDEATIEVSASRTTIVPESGIWAAASAISLIISGAANYSSSVSPSASYSGDSTIQITNLNNSFSVGDYITIESTGSLRFSAESEDKGLPYASGSITNYDSFDNLIQRNSGIHSNVLLGNRSAVLVTGSINSNYLSMPTFTHQVENDEVIQLIFLSCFPPGSSIASVSLPICSKSIRPSTNKRIDSRGFPLIEIESSKTEPLENINKRLTMFSAAAVTT